MHFYSINTHFLQRNKISGKAERVNFHIGKAQIFAQITAENMFWRKSYNFRQNNFRTLPGKENYCLALKNSLSFWQKGEKSLMPLKIKIFAALFLLSVFLTAGCSKISRQTSTGKDSGKDAAENTNADEETSAAKSKDDGTISSGTGTEKEKPAAGKGNLQGKVLYNGQPAENIEVKLCEKYSQFIGGCSGETYTAKTDAQGEYLIKNITPGVYEGLIAKVFNTDYYIFATSGIISAAKYKIEADKTFFAPDTNLFKQDLKILNPKAGSKVEADNIEIKWEAYPDAAYYKFGVYGDSSTGAATDYDYINRRVDDTSYVLDKPLTPGTYSLKVEAFNPNGVKLSQSPDDIKFTVLTGKASDSAAKGK